jgi:hypothetical protein
MGLRYRIALCIIGVALATPALSVAQPSNGRTDWRTYRNERYAFRLSHPADSRVDAHREPGHQHISIGNTPDAATASESGQLHVDVLIYDHRLGHRLKGGCRELLRDARSVKVGKVRGLRGLYQQQGTEDSSAMQALCVESTKLEILVKAVEGEPQTELANRVLDSVRFGN